MNGEIPQDLDRIYDWADLLMSAGRLADLDAAISGAKISDLSTDNLLGLLTATLPVRSKLPSRKQLYEEVERVLTDRGEMEPGLLDGLA